MVYTDGIHLIADSVSELHSFARLIRLGSHWFHNSSRGKFPHYDLYTRHDLRKAAVAQVLHNGGIMKTTRELVKILQEQELKRNPQTKLEFNE